ncbi:hypothetical protein Acr_13g0009180 [Actinidia rufa]|uniref:Uncharacterized protein n=1 Tax=Actinidia rufa TaxID=165716 RepID=A0A7J0FLC1_9ERIC|nr:hypothetical protein Acr_13g0009180 [Actinidia rufa]
METQNLKLHDTPRDDPYSYIEQEEKYTEAIMSDTDRLQSKLQYEIASRFASDLSIPPLRWGQWHHTGVPGRVHYLDKLHQKTGRSYQFTSSSVGAVCGNDTYFMVLTRSGASSARNQELERRLPPPPAAPAVMDPLLSGDHQVTIDPLAAKNGEDNIGGERVENSVPLRRNLHQRGVGPNADEAQSHAVQSKAKTVVALEHTGETRPIWDEQMRQMQAQLAGVIAAVKEKGTNSVEELINRTDTPFTPAKETKEALHILVQRQTAREGDFARICHPFLTKETLYVDDLDQKVAVAAFIAGVGTPKFLFSLAKEAPKTMAALMLRAQKYMNAEDTLKAREDLEGTISIPDRKRSIVERKDDKVTKVPKLTEQKLTIEGNRTKPARYNQYFTPLNTSLDQPVHSPLVGFTGDRVTPLGSIALPVTLGDAPRQTTKMVKFPTSQGVGEAKGNQQTARECYMASLKGEIKEAMVIEELEVRDEEEIRRAEPVEELEEVVVSTQDQTRVVKIGTSASEEIKEERIPRSQNEEADRLARIATSQEDDPGVPIEVLDSPSIQSPDMYQVEQEVEWANPIRAYLEQGILPEDKIEARRIKYRSSRIRTLHNPRAYLYILISNEAQGLLSPLWSNGHKAAQPL